MDENVLARVNKGNGTVNTIISLIEEISFGEFTFQTALLFRNAMLVNSILCSSEVLYGLTNDHIKMLEECDKSLFIRLFNVPFTCSYEALFLETGCLPFKYILKGRRLLYYWTLLNKPEEELAKKVFNIQTQLSVKDDWVEQVKMDLNELEIELTEYQIKTLKKEAFKRILKCKLGEKAYEYLLNLKENHSKTEHLLNYKLQDYLLSENLSFKQKRLL